MPGFITKTEIRATPDKVWAILTEAGGYAQWNPEITRIDGRIALGEKIKAYVNLGKGVIRPVSVRVTELDRPRRMVWTGGLPLGLFTGQRIYTLERRANWTTGFSLELQFSGPLAGPIVRSLGNRQPDIDALAAGLKNAAEGK